MAAVLHTAGTGVEARHLVLELQHTHVPLRARSSAHRGGDKTTLPAAQAGEVGTSHSGEKCEICSRLLGAGLAFGVRKHATPVEKNET